MPYLLLLHRLWQKMTWDFSLKNRFLKSGKVFSCLGTIEPSLVSIQKTDLKLKPPIQMNVRYSIREDESKASTPPQRKCYSKCKQKITRNKIYFGNEIVEQVSCSSNSSDLVHFTLLIWVRYQLGVTIFR